MTTPEKQEGIEGGEVASNDVLGRDVLPFPRTFDAQIWAREFVKTVTEIPAVDQWGSRFGFSRTTGRSNGRAYGPPFSFALGINF